MERELSLHVPAAAKAAVAKALRARKARSITLRALYFDTASRALARAGIALRVRREGRRWVQTVKAPGSDPLTRIEINHPRKQADPDLDLYRDGPLADVFAKLAEPLELRYETLVRRQTVQEQRAGSVIEIAYDDGVIRAGGWTLPISEIEFELASGDMDALFAPAKEWLTDYGLILETRSKAERGDRLAGLEPSPSSNEDCAPPASFYTARRSARMNLEPNMSLAQGYVACAGPCLVQIMANAALLAGVDSHEADDENRAAATHQLRVGIRRLRSCWKLFRGLVPAVDEGTADALKSHFGMLGEARNQDVIRLTIAPLLKNAGMPSDASLTPPPPLDDAQSLQAAMAGPEFQALLLSLLQHLIHIGDTDREGGTRQKSRLAGAKKRKASKPEKRKSLAAELPRRLDGWWADIVKRGRRFDELVEDDQHSLRKRIKLMRYGLECGAGLLPKDHVKALGATLADAQDILGKLNDYYVAESHYRGLADDTPAAWFAIGWLRAMQARQIKRATAYFKRYRPARRADQKKKAHP